MGKFRTRLAYAYPCVHRDKLTAYLDGNQYCDTVAVSGNIAPNYDATIMAGGDPNSTGTIEDNTYFKGKMKNVGIMNYAMTPEEVRLQYQNPNIAYYFYPGSTLTLAAMWQTGYTVVYNANGGTGLMNNQPCTTGQTYVTTANQFVREGYKFAGWNTEANGTGTAYAVGQSFTNLAVNGATATLRPMDSTPLHHYLRLQRCTLSANGYLLRQ